MFANVFCAPPFQEPDHQAFATFTVDNNANFAFTTTYTALQYPGYRWFKMGVARDSQLPEASTVISSTSGTLGAVVDSWYITQSSGGWSCNGGSESGSLETGPLVEPPVTVAIKRLNGVFSCWLNGLKKHTYVKEFEGSVRFIIAATGGSRGFTSIDTSW